MKRTNVALGQIAQWDNLLVATHKAAKGRRDQPQVASFMNRVDENLSKLRIQILSESLTLQPCIVFHIRDPKPRTIQAPSFRDRVLHHAVMSIVGPVLDRSLVEDTFACRAGKGTLAAIKRAQQHSRRFPWYVKLDVHQYFANIDHELLKTALQKRVKGTACLRLLDKLVDGNAGNVKKGLPIGALTSQHFANFYLSALDRFISNSTESCAIVRYMDDVIVWCRTSSDAQRIGLATRDFLQSELRLRWNDPIQVQRSSQGLTFCGFRIFPSVIRIARSRRIRLVRSLNHWEAAYRAGTISALQLQRASDSIFGMLTHVESKKWLAQVSRHRAIVATDPKW